MNNSRNNNSNKKKVNSMYQIGNYYIDDVHFSKGAFSKVYKGYHIYLNYQVAIKKIKVKNIKKLKKQVKREIELHTSLSHQNIVKLYDVIFDEDNNLIYMVMEYCKNGDLSQFQNKKPINEIYVQNFIYQLKEGLIYLRDNNIIHRDLKPQNLLLTDSYVLKITDFGLAKKYSLNDEIKDLKQTYCGSPMYMSPEILHYDKYNTKSDLWSIGIIIYELITGYPPYHVKNFNQLLEKIKKPISLPNKYKFELSYDCLDILDKLLNRNKDDRIGWDDFFNHNWLKNNKLIEYENNIISNPLNYKFIDNKKKFFNNNVINSNNNPKNHKNNINHNNHKNDKNHKNNKNHNNHKNDKNHKNHKNHENNNKNVIELIPINDITLNSDTSSFNSKFNSNSSDYFNKINSSAKRNYNINNYSSNLSSSFEFLSDDILLKNSISDNISIENSNISDSDSFQSISSYNSKTDVNQNANEIISNQSKSKPIDIKFVTKLSFDRYRQENIMNLEDPCKNMRFDFHNFDNKINNDINKNNSYDSSYKFKKILTSSFNILKESYDYINSNNKSL